MQHEHGEFAGDAIHSLTLEIMVIAIDIRPQYRRELPSIFGIFSQLEFYQVIVGA